MDALIFYRHTSVSLITPRHKLSIESMEVRVSGLLGGQKTLSLDVFASKTMYIKKHLTSLREVPLYFRLSSTKCSLACVPSQRPNCSNARCGICPHTLCVSLSRSSVSVRRLGDPEYTLARPQRSISLTVAVFRVLARILISVLGPKK